MASDKEDNLLLDDGDVDEVLNDEGMFGQLFDENCAANMLIENSTLSVPSSDGEVSGCEETVMANESVSSSPEQFNSVDEQNASVSGLLGNSIVSTPSAGVVPVEQDNNDKINEHVQLLPKHVFSPNNVANSDSNFDEGIAVGYLHNVSPVKSGNYFDFVLQTKTKTVRGVCFSREKRKRFLDYSENCSPVKVKKFEINTKANAEDLVMASDVSVEAITTIDFPKIDLPTVIDLSIVKTLCVGQLVSFKAKVSKLNKPKQVQSGRLSMVEGMLVDPSGTIKVILWQEFGDKVCEGNTYMFNNVRVKKDKLTKEMYVNTAKSGTTITATDSFHEILPITPEFSSQHSCNTTTVVGEVLGVEKVSSYLCCVKCSKKVEATHRILECSNCHMKQKTENCQKHWYAHILFKSGSEKFNITVFQDVLNDLVNIDFKNMTEGILVEILLTLPVIELSFQKYTKIASNIAVA